MRFSADGSRLWTGAAISGVKEWEFPSAHLLRTFWPGSRNQGTDLLPEQGLAAMITTDSNLWLMDLNTAQPRLVVPASRYTQPVLSPDGSHVVLCPVPGALGGQQFLQVLRVSDATVGEPIIPTEERFFRVAFFFNHTDSLAVDFDEGARRFHIGQQEPVWERASAPWPVALAPSGEEFVALEDDVPLILDSVTGEVRRQLPRLPTNATAVAWSPEASRLAFGLKDRTVEIRQAGDGTKVSTLTG